jgi:cytoskeletal protein RodZ
VTEREPTRLGTVLRTAREAKFIDLARVERDTKIRVRYLAALERGDYRDLPEPIYTRGFLRNYGLYLGLDPEYLVDLYRLESGAGVERPSMPVARRSVAARQGRSLVFSSGAIAAAILTVLVVAFVAYLVGEFVTFARTPDLRITDPATDVAAWQGSDYTIRGITEPNSTITTAGLRQNPTATADAQGNFSVRVGLVPGANVITLVASDPLTGRDSASVRRTITVLSAPSPTPSSAPSAEPTATPGASAGRGQLTGAKIAEREPSRRERWPIHPSTW